MPLVNLVDPVFRFTDKPGRPLSGGRVYTRKAGTAQDIPTYADNAQPFQTLNTNPIILDSRGVCRIWVQSGDVVKLDVHDSNDVWQYSTDYATPTASTESIISSVVGLRFRSGPSVKAATSSIETDDIGRVITVNGGICALPNGRTDLDGVSLFIHAYASTNLSGQLMDINGYHPAQITIGAGASYLFVYDHAIGTWRQVGRM